MSYRIRETTGGKFLIDKQVMVTKRKTSNFFWPDKYETVEDWCQIDHMGKEIPHYSVRNPIRMYYPAKFKTLKKAKKFVALQIRGEVIHEVD